MIATFSPTNRLLLRIGLWLFTLIFCFTLFFSSMMHFLMEDPQPANVKQIPNKELQGLVAHDRIDLEESMMSLAFLSLINTLCVTGLMLIILKYLIKIPLDQTLQYLQSPQNHRNALILRNPFQRSNEPFDRLVAGINQLRDVLLSQNASKEDSKLAKAEQGDQTIVKKTNLIRSICHDLANPLTVISGSAEILTMDQITPDAKKQRIQSIQRACQVISEILDHVKKIDILQNRKHSFELKPVDLKSVFANLEFIFADQLTSKGLQLKIENHLPLDTKCLADAITLSHQVISNLLSNAIKFSYENSEILIKAEQTKDHRIHIQVIDQGIGIPQNLLINIFDHQSSKIRPGTNGEKGSGFGLSLVKSFVDVYGGDIEVESTDVNVSADSHGSTVHVYLKSA